ncbi:fibrobacter succinogenes major paralogous domain-containing protein [Sphingobacterium bovistauri]|uniref:Fibrobacter succinogenes major paralogous domain-containing protein n=1 Tax=Sphingobacterium bovistauri TaxID=2781959 RepID=A0ABS7Z5X1_9SPHI|nr:fibrobacter succinogenes major paralogous domain-containing protein [Sphingobacterium bovistauri]MCA5004947.1 hypothetical protein [Sphingobacterium bovistauri]
MTITKLSFLNRIVFFTMILFVVNISCKSEKSEINENSDKIVDVSFEVGGIEDPVIYDVQSNTTNIINNSKSSKEFNTNNIISGEDFFIEFTNSTPSNNHVKHALSSNLWDKKSNKSALTFMQGSTVYKMLIYENINGVETFKNDVTVNVGQAFFKISLDIDRVYTYYAYSYNNTTIPPLPADFDNPIIESKNNAPFLLATGTINLGQTPHREVLTFKHKTSRISVAIDALSYFASAITNVSAKINNVVLTTHDFNLKNGARVGNAKSSILSNSSLTFGNLNESLGSAASAQKVSDNKLYTSSALSEIDFSITNLTVLKNNQSITLVPNGSLKTATVNGFVGGLGTVYRVYAYIWQGQPIGNNVWATGNLFYDATSSSFKFDQPYMSRVQHSCNHYFEFGKLYPKGINNTNPSLALINGDPCAKVYPENTWRTPSLSDLESLGKTSYGYENDPLTVGSTCRNDCRGYVYFNANNGEKVYFHEAGWITGSNCTVANVNDGLYWSSTQGSNNNNGTSVEIDERGGNGDSAGNEIVTTYPKTYGFSIRCVKNL